MASSKLSTLMRSLITGVQDILITVRDVKNVNRVLEQVGKDESFNARDPSSGFEIENFKHSLREAVILSNRFVVAAKNLAKYSSNEGHIRQLTEDLTAGNSQRLKPYFDGIGGHLNRSRMRVEEYQAEFSKISEKAHQMAEIEQSESVISNNWNPLSEEDVNWRSNIAGAAAAFFSPGAVALIFREFSLFYLFVYAFFGIGGFVLVKKGISMLLKRSGPYTRRAQDIRHYNSEIQLQTVQDSITTFLTKAPGMRSKLLQLEECAKDAAECVGAMDIAEGQGPANRENNKYNELKAQLSELQHKMVQLLKCVDEESDTEQYSTP